MEYAEEQWSKETPPPAPEPQEVVLDVAESEDGSAAAAEKKKYRDEAIYRPKQVLSSEDGIAFYRIWRDQATTYFKMSGHTEKEAEKQKCVLITLLDVKLAKILSQNMNDSGVITNFDNMLKELDGVFDDLYPLNGRRAALFNHRQGSENWVEWIASLGDDWEECGMNALGMEQLKAIMAIHLTDSKPIKDELLKIPTDKLFFKEIRRVGREAQGRLTAKNEKTGEGANINHVSADRGGGRGRG